MIERSDTIQVPKGVGIDGFLAAIRKILRLPRVQSLSVDTRGVVRYTRAVSEDEAMKPLDVEFDALMPGTVIRGSELQEIEEDLSPSAAVCRLFMACAEDRLYPVAFVSGPRTTFWMWHELSEGIVMRKRDEAYGIPFVYDGQIPDYVLVLCTAYLPGSSMVDVRKCYKVTMPEEHRLEVRGEKAR